MSKGDTRRPTDEKKVRKNWPKDMSKKKTPCGNRRKLR